MLREGGVWGVPRSGLTFTKQGGKLVLTEVGPHMPGMPVSEAELRKFQNDDYMVIKQHFETAGIPVERGDVDGEAEKRRTRSHI